VTKNGKIIHQLLLLNEKLGGKGVLKKFREACEAAFILGQGIDWSVRYPTHFSA
jgi:hypothetical protein